MKLMLSMTLTLSLAFCYTTSPIDNDSNDVRVGIVLSAGGALGLAHIGVLKILEQEGIRISCISANSMGSIIGGLYAAGYSPAEIESIACALNWPALLKPGISFGEQFLPERQHVHRYVFRLEHKNFYPIIPSELISLQNVELFLMKLLAQKEYNAHYNFDSLSIPLRIIAVDLSSGQLVTFKDGSIQKAIRGSIAIPGVFAPSEYLNQQLVDGGVLQYLPAEPILGMEPDIILAVLTTQFSDQTRVSLLDVISRTTSMVGSTDIQQQKKLVDILIEPDMSSLSAQDYSRVDEIIRHGESAAKALIPVIRKALAGRKPAHTQRVIPNRPLPIVKSLTFEGMNITHENTIRSIFKTACGCTLSFDQLHSDLTALYGTGLFKRVNYRCEFPHPDSVDIIVEIQERPYGFYFLGIRYDNDNNATLGLEIGQSNLEGSGVSIRGVVNLGDPNEYRIGLSDVCIPFLRWGYNAEMFWSSIDRSYYEDAQWLADYNIDYRGIHGGIGRPLGANAYFTIGCEGYQTLNRLPALPLFDTLPASEWIVGPSLTLAYNSYDDLYLPSRGITFTLTIQNSSTRLGSTNDFTKISFTSEQYIPLTQCLLFHTGIDVGASFGALNWAAYFHTGGADFVGYRSDGFTTPNRLVLQTGFDINIASALFGSNHPVYIQVISNLGYFEPFNELLQNSELSANDLHIGIGAGMRTDTPIGPIYIRVGFAEFHSTSIEMCYSLFVSLGRDFSYTK